MRGFRLLWRSAVILFGMVLTLAACLPRGSGSYIPPTEAACDEQTTVPTCVQPSGGARGYHVTRDGMRYFSGPYGHESDIARVVEKIRQEGSHQRLSDRALDMPIRPVNTVFDVYAWQSAAYCGGHAFMLYQSDDMLVLEYRYPGGVASNHYQQVRDFLQESNPFSSPGLWGPSDHVLDSTTRMCIVPGNGAEDGMGLLNDASYNVGWRQSAIDANRQKDIGEAYAYAVAQSATCRP